MKEKDLPAAWAAALKAMEPGEMEMITLDDGQEFVIARRQDLEFLAETAGARVKKDWLKKLGIRTK